MIQGKINKLFFVQLAPILHVLLNFEVKPREEHSPPQRPNKLSVPKRMYDLQVVIMVTN